MPYTVRSSRYFLLCVFLPLSFAHATSTNGAHWHAAYFDAVFWGNYGGENRGVRFSEDVAKRTHIVVQIDSLLKNLKRQGELKHFIRWQLVDHYSENWNIESGFFLINGRKVYLRLTDSIAINKTLKKLWHIEDVVISPSKKAGMWLFSLHVGLSKTLQKTQDLVRAYDDLDVFTRPDNNLLWLLCESACYASHHFYQHETDGYYHTYTGLYLTAENVFKAQRLLLEQYNLKTTITSHFITPAIIKKYAYY